MEFWPLLCDKKCVRKKFFGRNFRLIKSTPGDGVLLLGEEADGRVVEEELGEVVAAQQLRQGGLAR
jgi:hypothetical protein